MTGRWPANVILSPGTAETLDSQSGTSKSTTHTRGGGSMGYKGGALGKENVATGPADEGGASRFFLNAGYEPWELEWILANGLRPCGT